MKKAIFTDLDGTLLTDDYVITDINKKAIKDAQAAGWDVILTTGKSFANSVAFYKELGLDTWFSTSQGQVLCKPNEGISYQQFINYEDAKSVLQKHSDSIDNTVAETTHGVYVKKGGDKRIEKYLGNNTKPYDGSFLDEIIGIYVSIKEDVEIEAPNMDIWKWDTGEGMKLLSFKPKGVNKVNVMEKLIKDEGYEKTVVFGNGRNDIKSLLRADLGMAMVNSHPEVLKVAKHISELDNNNSGVGIEIQKILKEEELD